MGAVSRDTYKTITTTSLSPRNTEITQVKSQKSSTHIRSEEQHGKPTVFQRVSTYIAGCLEAFFYKLGYHVASRPWTVIILSILITIICTLGLIKFEIKDSSQPIWIPKNSKLLKSQQWVDENFPQQYRYNIYIVTADNILSPHALNKMYEIDRQVKTMVELNNTEEMLNFNWSSICVKLSGKCWSNSILELWEFDEEKIKNLKDEEIKTKIRDVTTSPMHKTKYMVDDWLGGLTYDKSGHVVGAKAAKMLYVIKSTSSDDMNNKIVAPDLLWETKFIDLGKDLCNNLGNDGVIKTLDMYATRSFQDEFENSYGNDTMLMSAGIIIIVIYVAITLGKFNEVEHKVYVALLGVIGIVMCCAASYGMASALGMFYGPIHPIIPFLLLGLGVDDMFIITEAWNNLQPEDKVKELRIQIATTMKHAGVSITVTSITDFVAFAIGASTTLPALKSFCIYAALGILTLFILQSTFFVACLTIDQRRQKASRDACCIWIQYINYQPNKCSQRVFLSWFLKEKFAPILVTPPIKAFVIAVSVSMLSISIYGMVKLKAESNLKWFLPADSYLIDYINVQNGYFDDGVTANLYIADADYYKEREKIADMIKELAESDYVEKDSLKDWHSPFINWLNSEDATNVAWYFDIQLNADGYPAVEAAFYQLLNVYVATEGQQFYIDLKWNDTNPRKARHLQASKVMFKVRNLRTTSKEVAALKAFEKLTDKYYPNKSFIWAYSFRTWETNSIIRQELYINLSLAFGAVLIVTLLLIANIQVCLLVCLSVVMTLVNVCGFMHFWGLTVDTLTSMLLILSIGLAIDYSAHIGHKFMTISGTRNDRVKYTISYIGPAIVNGAFSTFLAVVLLATSDGYVFKAFFKEFFLVCVFGLFNGIAVLPVLLSCVGPPPYLTADSIPSKSYSNMQQSISTKELLPTTGSPVEFSKHGGKEGERKERSSVASATSNTDPITLLLQKLETDVEKQQMSYRTEEISNLDNEITKR